MCLETSRFSPQVRTLAHDLRENTANNIMHIDLKMKHGPAYEKMKALFRAIDPDDTKAVNGLDAHKLENDAFWATDDLEETMVQHDKRANHLTSQQYMEFFEPFVLQAEGNRRLIVEGPPSCGKTFILVRAGVHFLLQSVEGLAPGVVNVLLLCHSDRLHDHIRRFA